MVLGREELPTGKKKSHHMWLCNRHERLMAMMYVNDDLLMNTIVEDFTLFYYLIVQKRIFGDGGSRERVYLPNSEKN